MSGGGLHVLEFKMPCCPENIKTPIVSRIWKPQGTGIETALLSNKCTNPYRFSYQWDFNCPVVQTINTQSMGLTKREEWGA